MEMDLLDYTHAYFPAELFDTTHITGPYVFGKKGETYCALVGAGNLEFRDEARNNLIQKGKRVFWITEAGSKSADGSFEEFTGRILNNEIEFNPESLQLEYRSNGKTYELEFGVAFKVDGKVIDTNYRRYDSPYVTANRKDKTITFAFRDKTLFLDFENGIRRF
jgi:hypothetical protein